MMYVKAYKAHDDQVDAIRYQPQTVVDVDTSMAKYVVYSALAVLAGVLLAFCIKMNWFDGISQFLGRIFGWTA